MKAPDICPQCGTPLEPRAISCPQCGSDWQTGWSEGADVDWETPDYDELLENEFGDKKTQPTRHPLIRWLLGGLALLLGILMLGVLR